MATVSCSVEHKPLQGDRGTVQGVVVTCNLCGDEAECFGSSARSVRRALMILKENCEEDDSNFYIADDGSHED